MDPLFLAIIFFAGGLALLIAELLIPSHGLLGILACCCIGGAVVACFFLGSWVGVAAMTVLVFTSPFVFMWMMKMWPKTPTGKRLVLNAVTQAPTRENKLTVGQTGHCITEMRPLGECNFGDLRVEAISEIGIIPAQATVQIVGLESDGRPIVRVA